MSLNIIFCLLSIQFNWNSEENEKREPIGTSLVSAIMLFNDHLIWHWDKNKTVF